MNVASLELSRELYELIGGSVYVCDRNWYHIEAKTTGSMWFTIDKDHGYADQDPYDGRYPTGITHNIDAIAPAYDLGYLIRKLPTSHQADEYSDLFSLYPTDGDPDVLVWAAGYGNQLATEGYTPEDAACKLAIQLIKDKVIQV